MDKKMYSYIKKYHMIEPNDYIVVGVSGGPDSMCLFHLLLKLQEKISFSMQVVHINHRLRKEANDEAEFVKKVCKKYHVPCEIVEVSVGEIAKKEKISTEEAGRMVRYEAFAKVLANRCDEKGEIRVGKIAIAHNKNDSAETVLFHLFRGAGMQGLSGIAPVNGNIIRPLLCFERVEIESYLESKSIKFCTDLSNDGDAYTRNRIRHHIIPYAEEEVCENVVAHIAETAEMLQDSQDFIKSVVEKEKIQVTEQSDENQILIKKEPFNEVHLAIKNELIRTVLFEVAKQKKDITKTHISDIRALFEKQVGKELSLPYQVRAIRTYEGVVLSRKKTIKFCYKPQKLKEGEMEDPILGNILIEIIKAENISVVPEKKYTKWFDYDKIMECLFFRTRDSRDYLIINEQGSRKTVKEYMINEKIPKEQRDKTIVIADGSHVVWVIGHRISQYYKVTNETKRIIKVQVHLSE